MASQTQNNLINARSAYLRSAIHQPVAWNEWGPEAFAKAQQEDKPILLDIGAVWCHWCHVMDRESYENPAIAALINEHFIPVKVDRDERPDVDTRYQAAVSAISGQGGWPLTAFLTPDGKPFFGGTYFPPDDRHGRPGLRRVLLTMAEAFQTKREEVDDSARSVMAAIEHSESFDGSRANPGSELVSKLVDSALQRFDPRFGGFGSQPKFPHSAAIDLLLDVSSRSQDADQANAARLAAMVTLEKVSKGGIYDHLAGGFHRYSVDERWVVPHFEKMSYDNSEMLRNYVHAFQSTAEPECSRIARDIIRWIDEWLSDRENGGFYASQDADFSLDDDGDYFTWTLAEAAAVLSPEELAIAGPYFDIGPIGDMHHNSEKNVLHIGGTLEAAAQSANIPAESARNLLAQAKQKLYAARKLRLTPYVDKTMYVAWNAMMISAYLEAGRALEDVNATDLALKSLDRLLAASWNDEAMAHVIAYGETNHSAAPVPGVLDDYVFTGHAALDAWETTGDLRFFNEALKIAETAITRFHDNSKGGFFDTEAPTAGEVPLGALTARRKPLQDSPTPAGNPVAAALLLRLEALTGNEDFGAKGQQTLELFAGIVEHFGLYAASYGLALQRLALAPIQVCIVGSDTLAATLERAALSTYAVNKSVIRLRDLNALPPSLAETLSHLPKQDSSFAVLCSGFSCRPPITSADDLMTALASS